MFDNLWSLFYFDLPVFVSVIIVGGLTFIAWLSVVIQRPLRVPGSLIALTIGVLCDGTAVLNDVLGEKLFPMTAYGGSLEPFFYKWQLVSFALIFAAGWFLVKEGATRNRAA
ncbi:hypothetical protein ACFPT7_23885 [Acidicapsa dinghuensis]|uniref:Lycopene cyclase domain-containing protein n=1 Tax=Acidicapsa dinghuensis TaxID=2218256 RepID=A0ABW1ENC9_9BACT|nr:hypothetical protein [Acidicapsa dinghuensis]